MTKQANGSTSKKDVIMNALNKAAVKYKVIRDDNICVFSVNYNSGEMLIFADKHCPLYEVILNELGNPKLNYETGIVNKIINHLKKVV